MSNRLDKAGRTTLQKCFLLITFCLWLKTFACVVCVSKVFVLAISVHRIWECLLTCYLFLFFIKIMIINGRKNIVAPNFMIVKKHWWRGFRITITFFSLFCNGAGGCLNGVVGCNLRCKFLPVTCLLVFLFFSFSSSSPSLSVSFCLILLIFICKSIYMKQTTHHA